jgi:hypothetical protein
VSTIHTPRLPNQPSPAPSPRHAVQIVGTLEIGNLRLMPGDVLVVRTDRITSAETDKRIRDSVSPLLPQGCKVLVINPGVELSVLTKGEIEARVA